MPNYGYASTPDYGSSFGAPSTMGPETGLSTGTSSAGAGAGWGSAAGAALQGISSYYSQKALDDAKSAIQKGASEADFKTMKYMLEHSRKTRQEDKRYREGNVAGYRQFGAAGLSSPEYTEPPGDPADPYNKG